jgi:hypothetical protein
MDAGYRAVKIKVGSRDDPAGRDLRRIDAVRARCRAGARLMVDANGAWDLVTALRGRPALADFDVAWLEEPIWYDDVAGPRASSRARSHADRARRAALHARRLPRLPRRRRGALRAGRRRAPRRASPSGGGGRPRARPPQAGRAPHRRHDAGPPPPGDRPPGLHAARAHPLDARLLRRARHRPRTAASCRPSARAPARRCATTRWSALRRPTLSTRLTTGEVARAAGAAGRELAAHDGRAGHRSPPWSRGCPTPSSSSPPGAWCSPSRR